MHEIENIDSKFRLCILAAKRAKQLVNGATKKVDIKAENPLTIALNEIENGQISFHILAEGEEPSTDENLFEEELENEEEEMDLLAETSGSDEIDDDSDDEDDYDGDSDDDDELDLEADPDDDIEEDD